MTKAKVTVGGQDVNIATLDQAITATMSELKSTRRSFLVCTLNLDHLVKMHENKAFREAYSQARFVTADGFPIVMLSRLLGARLKRTAGSDMIIPLCQAAARHEYPVFLLGSTDSTLMKASQKLVSKCPGLIIAGTYAPSDGFDPCNADIEPIIEQIHATKPRICFLALGAPKQELLAARLLSSVESVAFLGVGASLDFLSGAQIRAPKLLQMMNLEWLWRLGGNPSRLWRRYARCAVLFVCLMWRSALNVRHQSAQ